MSADVRKLTGNVCDTSPWPQYAAILGASPSKGARSPVLWNAAFETHGVEATMLPMDVTAENLEPLLEALSADRCFIGGAVAVPFKDSVARWLGSNLSAEASAIGAVNCLFRQDGRLMGTNTDGEAARVSFESAHGSLAGKSVLLLGPGGAGKAVAAYLTTAIGANGSLTLAARSNAARDYAQRIGARFAPWSDIDSVLAGLDVVVNCTSIGAGAQLGQTPLTAEQLAHLPSRAIIYDIIYQPRPSEFLKLAANRGLSVLDGLTMNLEQAILAYGHAAPAPRGAAATRSAMQAAAKKLS